MSFVKWALVTLVTHTIQNNGFIIKGVTSTRWWRISRRRFRSWCYSSIEQLKMESLNYEPASIKIRKKNPALFLWFISVIFDKSSNLWTASYVTFPWLMIFSYSASWFRKFNFEAQTNRNCITLYQTSPQISVFVAFLWGFIRNYSLCKPHCSHSKPSAFSWGSRFFHDLHKKTECAMKTSPKLPRIFFL